MDLFNKFFDIMKKEYRKELAFFDDAMRQAHKSGVQFDEVLQLKIYYLDFLKLKTYKLLSKRTNGPRQNA